MDIKELKKALESEAGKELLESLIEDAKKPLLAKNEDMLGKLKKRDETISEFEKRLEKIEADKIEAEEKAAAKSGDIEKIKEQLAAKHAKELEKATEQIQKLSGQLQTHVVDGGLTAALIKAKVSPALMDAAKALIKMNFKGEVGDADGKPFAKFDGKTADEFVTGWAQSDAGKPFVLAAANSGGGSNGANGNGDAATANKSMKRSDFENLPVVDKVKVSKEGVTLTD